MKMKIKITKLSNIKYIKVKSSCHKLNNIIIFFKLLCEALRIRKEDVYNLSQPVTLPVTKNN